MGLSRQAFLTNPTLSSPRKRPNNLAGVKGQQHLPLPTCITGPEKYYILVCLFYNKDGLGRRARNKATHINDMVVGTRNWDEFIWWRGALCFSSFFFSFSFLSLSFFHVCTDGRTDGRGLQ